VTGPGPTADGPVDGPLDGAVHASPPDQGSPDQGAPDQGAPELPLLVEPREGIPEPLTTLEQLDGAIAALVAGSGPLAVDAERASGYRYSQRAYLIQLRRAGAGTFLIDPIALPDLVPLGDALRDVEWIIHAAVQDLPCLVPLGLRPDHLFDTELAGRLLGEERVALGTMIEKHLGVRLEKGHSAADWSTRPLPTSWLAYAALDVELLIELRDLLDAELTAQGKQDWAQQEFAAQLDAPAPAPRQDPWRRTSGIHALRRPRQLAEVRALWQARDEVAAARDIAPGRVLPDSAIITAVRAHPASEEALLALPVFGGRHQRRQVRRWFGALAAARALPDSELPRSSLPPSDGPPAASRWRERDPIAADRLAAVRSAIDGIVREHSVQTQNVLAGDLVRRFAWEPPPATTEAVRTWLADNGARPWQVELVSPALAAALVKAASAVPAPAEGA
jgi:ribonuclease D